MRRSGSSFSSIPSGCLPDFRLTKPKAALRSRSLGVRSARVPPRPGLALALLTPDVPSSALVREVGDSGVWTHDGQRLFFLPLGTNRTFLWGPVTWSLSATYGRGPLYVAATSQADPVTAFDTFLFWGEAPPRQTRSFRTMPETNLPVKTFLKSICPQTTALLTSEKSGFISALRGAASCSWRRLFFCRKGTEH